MRNIFLITIVALLSVQCQRSGTKKVSEKFPEGQLKMECVIDTTNHKSDTLEKTEYYKNGNIKITGQYKSNERDGEWQYFYKNGQLWSKGTFVNGKSDGLFVIYNEDGTLFMQSSYKEGKPDGSWIFYEKGKKKKEVIFANDSIIKETDF